MKGAVSRVNYMSSSPISILKNPLVRVQGPSPFIDSPLPSRLALCI